MFYTVFVPLNTIQKFPYHLINGQRLLSVVAGVVSFSADKPSNFHYTMFSVSPSLFKVWQSG